jgi:hypothetical protein
MKMQKITSPRAFLTTVRHRMQLKNQMEDKRVNPSTDSGQTGMEQETVPLWVRLLPIVFLCAMIGAIFLLDAILPLQGLWFFNAFLPKSWTWIFWPNHLLFPYWENITLSITLSQQFALSFYLLTWKESMLLFVAFLVIFLVYLGALYVLPGRVTQRFLLISTLLLGILFLLIPVVTSQDLFLYIGYARMAVLYHLNPFTVSPSAIQSDPVYASIFWAHQPSLYGPVWIGPIAALQWLVLELGLKSLDPVVLLLRLFGLAIHLGSTQLVWVLSGKLQGQNGPLSLLRRKQVTLAFAWNPLLLIEACVNVHADILMLFLLLLALWVLMYGQERNTIISPLWWVGVAIILALATGVKVNAAIFVPGLLLFAWLQRQSVRTMLLIGASYLITVGILTLPFLLGGSPFTALFANPSSSQDVNSLPEFLVGLYKIIVRLWAFPSTILSIDAVGSITHTLSILVFLGVYGWLCWKARNSLHTIAHLVCWMAAAWLLYCVFGSPWFWPWYAITLIGLAVLVASMPVDGRPAWFPRFSTMPGFALVLSLFSFGMLCLYWFFTWGPQHTSIPGLPGFHWSYLRGLWAWVFPLVALLIISRVRLILRKRGLQVVRGKS